MTDEDQTSIAQHLLELTQQMLNTGKSFSISLSMTNFSFSSSSQDKESPCQEVKKMQYKSPRQRKRDLIRKQNFIRKKLESPSLQINSEKQTMFDCEYCDYKNIKKRGLDTHVRQKHKTLQETPETLRSKPMVHEQSPTLSVSLEPRLDDSFNDSRKFKCDECEIEFDQDRR